jgi:hypothetical protein
MSKSTERVRIEVGFDGGQTLVALVDEASADKLEKALADGLDGALSLDSEDGRTVIATRRIVFLKRYARESRLGFGG